MICSVTPERYKPLEDQTSLDPKALAKRMLEALKFWFYTCNLRRNLGKESYQANSRRS